MFGSPLRIPGYFLGPADDTGVRAYVDPDDVSIFIEKPSFHGVEVEHIYGTDPNLDKIAVGKYVYRMQGDELGIIEWRWEGTDGAEGVGEGFVTIYPSHVVND